MSYEGDRQEAIAQITGKSFPNKEIMVVGSFEGETVIKGIREYSSLKSKIDSIEQKNSTSIHLSFHDLSKRNITINKKMPRHRGKYNPENEEPYELSRSKIEDFLACPACFYLEKVKGVPFPSGIPFSLNEATDVLFKRDFDRLREKKQTHPYLEKIGYSNLIPFEHPELGKWQDSLHFGAEGRLNTVHESTHLKIGGGFR